MVFITADAYKSAGVDVIQDNENDSYCWVKMFRMA